MVCDVWLQNVTISNPNACACFIVFEVTINIHAHLEGECNYNGSLFMSQWQFLQGVLCLNDYGE